MGKTSKKISLFNKFTTAALLSGSVASTFKNFTEASVKIFEADFGFSWGRLNETQPERLIYKTLNAPNNPAVPVRKRNGKDILFDSDIKKGNYKPGTVRNLKSYLLIPVKYGDRVYGYILVCYKRKRVFKEEEILFSETIGNTAAQFVTVNWLVEKEEKSLDLAQKQKETEVLLGQEKLKTEFIANATHELRTPLAIMKGNVDLALLSKGDLKTYKESLKEIGIEINVLAEILKDLALLTSSGKSILRKDKVNLADLLGKVVSRLDVVSNKKNISIQIKSKKTPDIFVLGDKSYLDKLFLNIVKNAITYGKENGYIKIHVSREGRLAKIKIADNGIGISKEELPRIFERFYQVEKSHTGSHSGLGLAIARWVAETHGGKIDVESKYGKGTVFTITLPISRT